MPSYLMYGLAVGAERHLAAPSTVAPPDIRIIEHSTRRPSPSPPDPRGYSYAVLENGSVHVSWSELFDFIVSPDGNTIDVYVGSDPRLDAAYTYLISQVISVALLQKGIESLHASAVAIDDQATVLIGDSGYGKSTLTAAMLQRGARLITDDLLVLEKRNGDYAAVPGATRIKLHPETAQKIGFTLDGVPMLDGSGKHVFLLPPERTVDRALPVNRILALQPGAPGIALRPASAAHAAQAILAATFNPLHTQRSRLELLLRNAQSVAATGRTFFLDVPRDLGQLNAVLDRVM